MTRNREQDVIDAIDALVDEQMAGESTPTASAHKPPEPPTGALSAAAHGTANRGPASTANTSADTTSMTTAAPTDAPAPTPPAHNASGGGTKTEARGG